MSSDFIIAMTTAPSKDLADKIAAVLIETKSAACVQITAIDSWYSWEGKVTSDAEFLLLIKTRRDLFDQLSKTITEIHSYQIPEIISIGVSDGSSAYLQWIDSVTARS